MSGDVKKRAKGRPSTTTKRPLTVKRNNRLRNFHKSLVRPASVYEHAIPKPLTLTCQKLGPRSKINPPSSV